MNVFQWAEDPGGVFDPSVQDFGGAGGDPVADAPFLGPGGASDQAADALGHWAPDPGQAGQILRTQRDAMIAEARQRGDAEVKQLETLFAAQEADLDRRFSGQLGGLDGEQTRQLGGLAKQAQTTDQTLAADLGKRTAAHATQITGEAKVHDATAAKYTTANDGGNEQDREKARVSAELDADRTLGEARAQAATLRVQGQAEADRARKDAAAKAGEARAAAAAYARKVPAAEGATVSAAGEQRAAAAIAAGERKAREVTARVDREAGALLARGERLAETQRQRGASTAAAISARGSAASAQIEGQAKQARAEMEGLAGAAELGMAKARGDAGEEHRALADRTRGKMDGIRDGAQAAAEAERSEAMKSLRATHEAQKKEIETRTQAVIDKIQKAKEDDLAKIDAQVERDLAGMEKLAESGDGRMKKRVARADGTLAARVAEDKRKLREEALAARGAGERIDARAKKALAAADAGTKQKIAEAARKGTKAIKGVGYDAVWEVAAENQRGLEAMVEMGVVDLTELELEGAESSRRLAGAGAGVGAAIEKTWIEDAQDEATGLFAGVSAMHALSSLPPDLQAKAIERMDIDELQDFMSSLPANRRENLEVLVANTHDPMRKLALWSTFHKGRAQMDGQRWGRDAKMAEATAGEVDEEVMYLLNQQLMGKPITLAQVERLMKRKAVENDLEMRHNVAFSNEGGDRADGRQIVWQADEMEALDGTLRAIPEAHLGKNPMIREFRREDVDTRNNYSAMHSGDKIYVYDSGASLDITGGTNVGDRPEMTARPCPHCGVVLTKMDMSIAHEMGHAVHDNDDENFAKFKKIAGWNEVDAADLLKAGVTQAEVDSMEAMRGKNNTWGSRPQIRRDGKIYLMDPYGKFLVVNEGAIPEGTEHEKGKQGKDDWAWAYSRTSPKEHFAEHYSKAITVPEQLHKDLVQHPAQRVKDAEAAVRAATTPAAKQTAQAELKKAEAAQKVRQEEFTLMRDEVFDADAEVDAAAGRLAAKGLSGTTISAFRTDAQRASTPEQVRFLEGKY